MLKDPPDQEQQNLESGDKKDDKGQIDYIEEHPQEEEGEEIVTQKNQKKEFILDFAEDYDATIDGYYYDEVNDAYYPLQDIYEEDNKLQRSNENSGIRGEEACEECDNDDNDDGYDEDEEEDYYDEDEEEDEGDYYYEDGDEEEEDYRDYYDVEEDAQETGREGYRQGRSHPMEIRDDYEDYFQQDLFDQPVIQRTFSSSKKTTFLNKHSTSERTRKVIRGKESSDNLKRLSISSPASSSQQQQMKIKKKKEQQQHNNEVKNNNTIKSKRKQQKGNKLSSDKLKSSPTNKDKAKEPLSLLDFATTSSIQSSSQISYWDSFGDDQQSSFLGNVLEYGIVKEIKSGNQFILVTSYLQEYLGITLKGFRLHNSKIEVGDIVVYSVIDSTFNFQISKVYISSKVNEEDIESLYRRGELSPNLYQSYHIFKRQIKSVINSQKANQLQDFLYDERTYCNVISNSIMKFERKDSKEKEHSPPLLDDLKESRPVEAEMKRQNSPPLDPLEREKLKELLHFNNMILIKVIDYFTNYVKQQPQMKAMILKMASSTLRLSTSMSSLQSPMKGSSNLSAYSSMSKLDSIDMGLEQFDEKLPRMDGKKKSKVGILFYLFFLETIHRLLYHLPKFSSGRYQERKLSRESRIYRIYEHAIVNYNINNFFGKLVRFLFQQILFYLCQNNYEYLQLICNFPVLISEEERTRRQAKYQYYQKLVDRITHMDIIYCIIPFLTFEDIYQCFFLLFPTSTVQFLHSYESLRSPQMQTLASTPSIFNHLSDLKSLINHFHHEINRNKDYFLIANDIYDIFSHSIHWEKFIQQLSN